MMKKLIVSLFVVLLGAASAMGQISFYGEWRRKISNELDSKVWTSPEFSRLEQIDDKGEKVITIFDLKEKKAYIMNETHKTCMVMENLDEMSSNKMLGYDFEVAKHTSREFKGMEVIDGKECAHYYVKTESVNKGGGKDVASYNEWIYEPMKASNYNGAIASDNNIYLSDKILVLRNIKMGAQPAHLFKIPEGYKTTVLPAGGLLEMITGKSRDENTKSIDGAVNSLKNIKKSVDEKADDPNKSKEEQMNSLLEMLGGAKKK